MYINKNYIFFIWIIALILFIYYCIFRVKYINEKYYDLPNPTLTQPANEKYYDLPNPTLTQPANIISYIENIQKNNKIIDIENCKNVYDDNIEIRKLGFGNCQDGYLEYVNKNLDINRRYDNQTKTFAEICPVSSNSEKYTECAKLLLTKFSDNNIILDNITSEMTDSINKRLNDRNVMLDNTQIILSPFIYSKNQKDFDYDILLNKQVAEYSDQTLNLVDTYYQDKYKYMETFTNVLTPGIESIFFGTFRPIDGQMIALNDLMFSIEYDSNVKKKDNLDNSPYIPLLNDSIAPTNPITTKSAVQSDILKPISNNTEPQIVRPVIFTIRNNDLHIVYNVKYIGFYKTNKNAVQFILDNKNILANNYDDTNVTEQLLSMLGLNNTSHLLLVVDKFISTEKKKHTNFRLVNNNLDTILILRKQK